jgi:polar amino acid transport system substrate-binding protein
VRTQHNTTVARYGMTFLQLLRVFSCSAVCLLAPLVPAWAQDAPAPAPGAATAPAAEGVPQKRLVIRFLTTDDFPPFNYYDDEGILTGLNVDLARAICLDAQAACDIKVRPWEELITALRRGDADAVIAAHVVGGQPAAEVDFTDRYFQTPGRFAGPAATEMTDVNPEALYGKTLGVAKGTTHEAFLRAFFRDSRIETFENAELARDALSQGKVDLVFDDAIGLSFWLKGTLSRACCEFKGGAFLEPKYFGDGLAIAVNRNDPQLKAQINEALKKIRRTGRFEEIVNRYFPLGLF